MAIWLRQSTASQEVCLGPFVDSTDGKTAKTGLTIANTDIVLWKMGATSTGTKNSGGGTHMAGGLYSAVLDATDSNTLGGLVAVVNVAGALPVRHEFQVLPANIYDSLIAGSDLLDVSMVQVAGSAVSTSSAQIGVNVVNAAGTAWGSGAITAASIATDAITNAKIAADAIGASEIADGAIDAGAIATGAITAAKFAASAIDATAIASNAITSAKIASGAITAATFAAGAIDAAAIAADAIGSSELAASAVTEIQSGLATASALTTVDTVVNAIKAVTDLLPDAGALTSIAQEASLITADDVWDEVFEGSLTARHALRLFLAALCGKLSGAATTTVAIRDNADAKDRITATVDANGNRSAVTLDAT